MSDNESINTNNSNDFQENHIFSPTGEYIFKQDFLSIMENVGETQRSMPPYFYGNFLNNNINTFFPQINLNLYQRPQNAYNNQVVYANNSPVYPQRNNFIQEPAFQRIFHREPMINNIQQFAVGSKNTGVLCKPSNKIPKTVLSKCHFDKESTDILCNHYENISKFISRETRAELANKTNLNEQQVKTWFQNRRMKEKRQQQEIKVKSEEEKENYEIISKIVK